MNSLAILIFAAQSLVWSVSPSTVTVGDTVRVTRRVSAEFDARANVLPMTPTDAYLPLSDPIAAYSEGAMVIRYQLAFFETGVHAVPMPNLEILMPDAVDILIKCGLLKVHLHVYGKKIQSNFSIGLLKKMLGKIPVH